MMKRFSIVLFVLVSGTAFGSSSQEWPRPAGQPQSPPTQTAPAAKPGERSVRHVPGQPVDRVLREDDRILTIVSDQPPPMLVGPPGGVMTNVEWLTTLSEYVALVDVTASESSLSEKADWVFTTHTASVVELLKDVKKSIPLADQQVSFRVSGGQINVRGRQVRAGIPWTKEFKPGHQYLIFGSISSEGELRVGALTSYEVVGQRLTSMADIGVGGKPANDVGNLSPGDAVELIRLAARQPGQVAR